MKLFIKLSILFLFIFLAVFFWVTQKNLHTTDLEKAYLKLPVKQEVEDREWINVQFEEKKFNSDLYNPLLILHSNNNFLVVDYGDKIIKKFDVNAQLIEKYGKGRGQGPGEALNYMDVQVDSQGKIWALDGGNSRLTIFDDQENWEIVELRTLTSRMIPLSEHQYFMKPRHSSTSQIRSLEDEVLVTFDSIVTDDKIWSNVLGFFSTLDFRGGIIRANIYTNDIIRYKTDGSMDYFRKSIGHPELPPIIPPRRYSDDQTIFFNEVDPQSVSQRTFDVQVINDQIHLLIDYQSGEERIRDIIDVYKVETGDYLYSYRLPTGLINFSITENHLAGLPQDSVGIAIWEINSTW